MLPESIELAPKLAAELRQISGSNVTECAMGGIAGPIIAIIFGVMDGLGMDEYEHEFVAIGIRRELRHLGKVVGPGADEHIKLKETKFVGKTKMGIASDDLLLEWCASSAVPTYHIGIHIALGDLDSNSEQLMVSLAWVFRLLCYRARIDIKNEAPMFAMVCEALCRSENTLGKIQEAITVVESKNRSLSLPPSGFPEGDAQRVGKLTRSNT